MTPAATKHETSSSPEGDAMQPVAKDEFGRAHGESLATTLDLATWSAGPDLLATYARLEQEVAEAVEKESEIQRQIRKQIFPMLASRPGAPKGAGVFRARVSDLEEVHEQILFNGAVEACDGTVASFDTLPVTITQIGVCLVSYRGDQGSWFHRLYRRDLRSSSHRSIVDETWELLDQRRDRSSIDQPATRDRLSSLARRGIMAYAERAVLLDRSEAVWRMGHGNPTPFDLITGSGMVELALASFKLLKRMVLDHKKFVFVPSAPKARELLSVGNALEPLEYAIVGNSSRFLRGIAEGHYRGESWGTAKTAVDEFASEVGPKIAVGLYRASALAPAQMFYAHEDYCHEAALIAMADSVLQEHRGFPLLVDIADKMCSASFGAEAFSTSTQSAYARAGEPYRYLGERRTRK